MHAAAGILTTRGGMTSHAAVVARGMGRPCVCRRRRAAHRRQGRHHDGRPARCSKRRRHHHRRRNGRGAQGPREDAPAGAVGRLRHGDAVGGRVRGRWACAPTPTRRATPSRRAISAPRASGFAAPSTCSSRTSRILAMREMICADDEAGRRAALAKILPMQRADFEELFEIMAGLPVTIRLLDPPLHEFLPHDEEDAGSAGRGARGAASEAAARVAELHEFNPMLGFRGCRLAIRYPEITEMQARAIFEAAVSRAGKTGKPVRARGDDPARRLPRGVRHRCAASIAGRPTRSRRRPAPSSTITSAP